MNIPDDIFKLQQSLYKSNQIYTNSVQHIDLLYANRHASRHPYFSAEVTR